MTQIEFFDKEQRKFNITIPSEWDEMTASQVQFVFKNYERCLSGDLSPLQLKILVLYNMLGLKRPSRKTAYDEAIVQNVARICEHLDFIFVQGDERTIPQLSFCSIQNPLPTVRTKARVLTGPAALCQDLTFGEFRNAALALNSFFRSEDITNLDECVAHLYRPRSRKANKAGRFVKHMEIATFPDEIKEAGALPMWQKNLVMMWFAACINYLQSGKIQLGGDTVEMDKLFSEGDDGVTSTWNDLLIQLAKEGTIGNVDAVDEAPLMVVILHMWSNYKENKRYENAVKARKA